VPGSSTHLAVISLKLDCRSGNEPFSKSSKREIAQAASLTGALEKTIPLSPRRTMLERFTRERQRASKGAAFHLEDEVDSTHYGQGLSKWDDSSDAGLELEIVKRHTSVALKAGVQTMMNKGRGDARSYGEEQGVQNRRSRRHSSLVGGPVL